MNGPVATALAGSPALRERFEVFRSAAHEALGAELTAQVERVVAQVHGLRPEMQDGIDSAALAYARRIPFEHTAITDAEAAAVVAELGEARFVAFSVVAALADAECRAEKVGLQSLVAG